MTSLDQPSKINDSSSPPYFHHWVVKMIETVGPDVGDISTSRQTHSQKNNVSATLMAHVLEACDLDSYANTQGQFEWKQAMTTEMNPLLNNQTQELVP